MRSILIVLLLLEAKLKGGRAVNVLIRSHVLGNASPTRGLQTGRAPMVELRISQDRIL